MSLRLALQLALTSVASTAFLGNALPACGQTPVDQTYQFNIPAGPLGESLLRISDVTGIDVYAPADLVRGKNAIPVSGALTARQAIERLLSGSGLTYSRTSSGGFVIAAAADDATSTPRHSLLDGNGAFEIDAIVVLGVRESLASALRLKRNSDGVTDSVVAEDIARFPSENLAEAIQHIPGVAIARDQGEGTFASLRGLPPSLVRVEVNGQTAVSGQVGREFSFDVFSADLFSSVQVFKSSTPDRDEGGVAGTIRLSTPNPLDLDDMTVRFNSQASYVELADEYDARASGLVSRQTDDGQLGAMFGVAYSGRSLRQDNSSGNGWDALDLDLDNDGSAEHTGLRVARTLRTQLYLEQRDRIGATTKVQFRPTSSSELAFDATYTNFNVDRYRTNHSYAFSTGTPVAVTAEGDTAVVATVDNTRIRTTVRTETVENQVFLTGLRGALVRGDWNLSSALTYGIARATVPDGAVVGYLARADVTYDIRNDPRFPETSGGPDPSTGEALRLNQLAFDSFRNRDEEIAFQADAHRQFGGGWLTDIRTGLKVREATKNREATDDRVSISRGPFLSEMYLPFPVDDFFEGQGGPGFPRSIAVPDINQVRMLYYPAIIPSTPDLLDTFEVRELSHAGYVRADFDLPIGGLIAEVDVGARFVRTEQTSSGFVEDDGAISSTRLTRDYTDVLPSANLRIDLSDQALLRIGVASVMTRPALNDISPRREIFSGQLRVEEGNVDLDPFRADQLDVSLEFYPADGTLISAALFYKDIKSFTATRESVEAFRGDNYLFSRIVNGEGGEVHGLELTYQQPFTFLPAPFHGLGTAMTYTYASSNTRFPSEITTEELPLEGLSKNSYNATLYYETDRFGLRASYNYRDGYVLTALGAGGAPVFVDDYGQLDVSGSLRLTDRLNARVDVLNVLDERTYSYSGAPSRITDYDRTGPKYFFGLGLSF